VPLRRSRAPELSPAPGKKVRKNIDVQHFQNTDSTFSNYQFNIFKLLV